MIAERDSTGGVTKTYIRGSGLGGGIGDIVAAWSMVDGQWLYFSYNHRGDVVTVTSNTGARIAAYEYDAFGAPLNTEPGTLRRVGFSSKEYDAKSGLSYYGFRYYDAQSGRWMTKDPLCPFGKSFYAFVAGNPNNSTDYRGLVEVSNQDTCGPKVDDALMSMIAEVRRRFTGLGFWQRVEACSAGLMRWDIAEFYGTHFGTGLCKDTVTLDGRCYWKWDINYVLYGAVEYNCSGKAYPEFVSFMKGQTTILLYRETFKRTLFRAANDKGGTRPYQHLAFAIGYAMAKADDNGNSVNLSLLKKSYKADKQYETCCSTTNSMTSLTSRWP